MAAAVRSALLRHLRVKANAATAPLLPRADPRPLGGLLGLARRGFSEEARGTFLDKSEVADRVVTVVKNFQKVDPAKVLLNEQKRGIGRSRPRWAPKAAAGCCRRRCSETCKKEPPSCLDG
ncbi:hypothetical protein Taro_023614 [Colocasia esculenta]|uniref:Uncharacterized protein n=1 Tax=Colocasia esculenta TaxID=4460 RepID=A0A843V487_COLES|nr:hypothetical protein [Colocasia esculenta]